MWEHLTDEQRFEVWVVNLLGWREYNRPDSERKEEVKVKELPSWFKK